MELKAAPREVAVDDPVRVGDVGLRRRRPVPCKPACRLRSAGRRRERPGRGQPRRDLDRLGELRLERRASRRPAGDRSGARSDRRWRGRGSRLPGRACPLACCRAIAPSTIFLAGSGLRADPAAAPATAATTMAQTPSTTLIKKVRRRSGRGVSRRRRRIGRLSPLPEGVPPATAQPVSRGRR